MSTHERQDDRSTETASRSTSPADDSERTAGRPAFESRGGSSLRPSFDGRAHPLERLDARSPTDGEPATRQGLTDLTAHVTTGRWTKSGQRSVANNRSDERTPTGPDGGGSYDRGATETKTDERGASETPNDWMASGTKADDWGASETKTDERGVSETKADERGASETKTDERSPTQGPNDLAATEGRDREGDHSATELTIGATHGPHERVAERVAAASIARDAIRDGMHGGKVATNGLLTALSSEPMDQLSVESATVEAMRANGSTEMRTTRANGSTGMRTTRANSTNSGGTATTDPENAPSDGSTATVAPPSVTETIQSPGRPLPPGVRQSMESLLGTTLGDVRIHTGASAAASAAALDARAYTVGRDVVFARGEFDPHSPAGRGVLAHELAHVNQQRSGEPVVNCLPSISLPWKNKPTRDMLDRTEALANEFFEAIERYYQQELTNNPSAQPELSKRKRAEYKKRREKFFTQIRTAKRKPYASYSDLYSDIAEASYAFNTAVSTTLTDETDAPWQRFLDHFDRTLTNWKIAINHNKSDPGVWNLDRIERDLTDIENVLTQARVNIGHGKRNYGQSKLARRVTKALPGEKHIKHDRNTNVLWVIEHLERFNVNHEVFLAHHNLRGFTAPTTNPGDPNSTVYEGPSPAFTPITRSQSASGDADVKQFEPSSMGNEIKSSHATIGSVAGTDSGVIPATGFRSRLTNITNLLDVPAGSESAATTDLAKGKSKAIEVKLHPTTDIGRAHAQSSKSITRPIAVSLVPASDTVATTQINSQRATQSQFQSGPQPQSAAVDNLIDLPWTSRRDAKRRTKRPGNDPLDQIEEIANDYLYSVLGQTTFRPRKIDGISKVKRTEYKWRQEAFSKRLTRALHNKKSYKSFAELYNDIGEASVAFNISLDTMVSISEDDPWKEYLRHFERTLENWQNAVEQNTYGFNERERRLLNQDLATIEHVLSKARENIDYGIRTFEQSVVSRRFNKLLPNEKHIKYDRNTNVLWAIEHLEHFNAKYQGLLNHHNLCGFTSPMSKLLGPSLQRQSSHKYVGQTQGNFVIFSGEDSESSHSQSQSTVSQAPSTDVDQAASLTMENLLAFDGLSTLFTPNNEWETTNDDQLATTEDDDQWGTAANEDQVATTAVEELAARLAMGEGDIESESPEITSEADMWNVMWFLASNVAAIYSGTVIADDGRGFSDAFLNTVVMVGIILGILTPEAVRRFLTD